MFKKTPMLSTIIGSMLGGVSLESLAAHTIADENGWYFVGCEDDNWKFHDVFLDKEINMTTDELFAKLTKR